MCVDGLALYMANGVSFSPLFSPVLPPLSLLRRLFGLFAKYYRSDDAAAPTARLSFQVKFERLHIPIYT